MLVVFVGNFEPTFARCQITGDQSARKSITARTISAKFDCTESPARADKRADLEVFIGSAYAQPFLFPDESKVGILAFLERITGSPSSPVGVISGPSPDPLRENGT